MIHHSSRRPERQRLALGPALLCWAMLVAMLAGCTLKDDSPWPGGGGGVQQQGDVRRLRAANDSMRHELEQVRAVSAEKDSALQQVRMAQDFIDEIDRQLSGIPRVEARQGTLTTAAGAEGAADVQTSITEKIARARALVEQSDSVVREREQRVRTLVGENGKLRDEVKQFQETVASYLAMLDRQREELARMGARVDSLEHETAELQSRNSTLSDSLAAMRDREETVYVAAGTAEELLARGVVVKEGGTHVAFWTPGATLQPARNPPRSAFRVLNMYRDRVIELPRPDAAYRIVSKQDPGFLDPPPSPRGGSDARVTGRLRVGEPRLFWGTSRYLILVEQ